MHSEKLLKAPLSQRVNEKEIKEGRKKEKMLEVFYTTIDSNEG
jgi:hypothetical protein